MPNKYKHLGAEIAAGEMLTAQDTLYFNGNVKAAIASAHDYQAEVDSIRKDVRDLVRLVAGCDIHLNAWTLHIRKSEVNDGRVWLPLCGTTFYVPL